MSRDTSWLTEFPGCVACNVFVYKHQKVCCNIFSGRMYDINLTYDMHFAFFEKFIDKVFRFSAHLGVR